LENQISDKGAEYLANALQKNKVTSSDHVNLSFTICSKQTLIALDLAENNIGDQGAEYIGNALLQNKVISQPSRCIIV